MNMPKPKEKPFAIPKLLVWEAWRQVKANKGAPGVDGQDLDEFEADLAGQPLQDLESDEFWVLLSAPGQGGGDPQAARPGDQDARRADGHRILLCRPTSFWVRWWSRIRSIRCSGSGSRSCMCVVRPPVVCMCAMAVMGGT